MKSKLNTDGIDEEFLLSTFRDRDIHSPRKEEKKVQETPVAPAQELTVQFFAELYLLFLIYRLTQMQLQEHTNMIGSFSCSSCWLLSAY